MHVRIDERRREQHALRLHDSMRIRVDVSAEGGDHAVVDADVEGRIETGNRIENARASDDEILLRGVLDEQHHATSSTDSVLIPTGPLVSRSYSTAILVTRPARTCVSISASAWSATRGSISTPRFIGPGCITFCPGRSRSGVIPQRAVYSRRLGTNAAPSSMRSRCIRSA